VRAGARLVLALTSLAIVTSHGCLAFEGRGGDGSAGARPSSAPLDAGATSPTDGVGGDGASGVQVEPSPTTLRDHCGVGCVPGDGECGGADAGDPCQLVPTDAGVIAECVAPGPSGPGEPCETATTCAAGLGCVGPRGAGACRPYCCGNPEVCPPATFCALQPVADDGFRLEPPLVPVCAPVTACQPLLDESTCPVGETCTIVRADGTTSCVVPGDGGAGEPCPCHAGLACSHLSNRCQRLCRIGHEATDCPGGAVCQGGSAAYPPGIGACIGGAGSGG
jgi:hypothetical protein